MSFSSNDFGGYSDNTTNDVYTDNTYESTYTDTTYDNTTTGNASDNTSTYDIINQLDAHHSSDSSHSFLYNDQDAIHHHHHHHDSSTEHHPHHHHHHHPDGSTEHHPHHHHHHEDTSSSHHNQENNDSNPFDSELLSVAIGRSKPIPINPYNKSYYASGSSTMFKKPNEEKIKRQLKEKNEEAKNESSCFSCLPCFK